MAGAQREAGVKSRASTMTRDYFTTSSVAARAQPRSTEPSKGPTLSQDALCSVSCCSNLLAARCAARSSPSAHTHKSISKLHPTALRILALVGLDRVKQGRAAQQRHQNLPWLQVEQFVSRLHAVAGKVGRQLCAAYFAAYMSFFLHGVRRLFSIHTGWQPALEERLAPAVPPRWRFAHWRMSLPTPRGKLGWFIYVIGNAGATGCE